MKDTQLTYILLIIASILLIANGIFAFERTLSMILMSILFILVVINKLHYLIHILSSRRKIHRVDLCGLAINKNVW
ncbi:hypothetical protein PYJ82_12135, partial [Staphylococcus epidermidis]|nr:hypothetical protein [Staphylococcus epidermidis]